MTSDKKSIFHGIEFKTVDRADRELLSQAADLHFDSLSYRSFITFFGKEFLINIYEIILSERQGFFVLALEGGRVKGICLSCLDSSRLMGMMMKRWPVFFSKILKGVIRKPSVVKKLWETLSYSRKGGSNINAELTVIAVEDGLRSRGVGTLLLERWEKELLKKGISKYKVTVHKDMERSNQFYIKNKMRLSG